MAAIVLESVLPRLGELTNALTDSENALAVVSVALAHTNMVNVTGTASD